MSEANVEQVSSEVSEVSAPQESVAPEAKVNETTQAVLEREINSKEPAVEGETEQQEYTPNFKYRVRDQEKEIDEYFKQFIKSKDDEEKFRDVLTRADGIEGIKTNLNETRAQLEERERIISQVRDGVENLKSSLAEERFEDFFDAWGLNDEKLFKYAAKRLKLQENPELREQYEAGIKSRREAQTYSKEREQLSQRNEELLSNQYKMEFEYSLQRPDVQDFAGRFDTMPGRTKGDFEQEVLKHGFFTHQKTGKDIPIGQAINDVVQMYQPLVSSFVRASTTTPKIVTQSEVSKPKTIPTVGRSGSTSPTRKKFTSIEDLEAEAERLSK